MTQLSARPLPRESCDLAAPGHGTDRPLDEPRITATPVVQALWRLLATRDEAMHEHCARVRQYALALARASRITDAALLDAIGSAALLHDIGKLAIPDRLLQKAGPLTAAEYAAVQRHATIGADVLAAMSLAGPLASIVRHHHENWDGSGYPDGLRGTSIPVGARILAIVDCYDALTSERPYRPELPHASAVAVLRRARGTMYDPSIMETFLGLVDGVRDAGRGCADAPAGMPLRGAIR